MKKFNSLGNGLLTDDPVLIEAQGAILTAENMQEASMEFNKVVLMNDLSMEDSLRIAYIYILKMKRRYRFHKLCHRHLFDEVWHAIEETTSFDELGTLLPELDLLNSHDRLTEEDVAKLMEVFMTQAKQLGCYDQLASIFRDD